MDFKTDNLTGFIIDGWDDCYDGCFAIEDGGTGNGAECDAYEFIEFWADTMRSVPTGAIYHEGYLIVATQADGLALMADLEREYNDAIENLGESFASLTYHDLGWV